MKKALRVTVFLAIGVLWFGSAMALFSADNRIFDNSAAASDLFTRFNPGTYQVGDQIILANTGNLTYFSFEYWGVSTSGLTFAGNVQADVRFYLNNGPTFNGYATPGATPFFDSGWFDVPSPTDRSTFIFTPGSNPGDLPVGGLSLTSVDMTWSVQFQGMGTGDSIGVDIYTPPVVGQDYPDYWQNDGTGWTLQTNSVPMDFAALMETPEPSSMTLSALGGLGILFALRRFRRNA
jgi:hypothetical protein